LIFYTDRRFSRSLSANEQQDRSPPPITIAGSKILVGDQSPLVRRILGVIQKQGCEIQILRDEIQRLETTVRPISNRVDCSLAIPDEENEMAPENVRGRERKNKTLH